MYRLRQRPLLDRLNLCLVHLDPSRRDDVAEELDGVRCGKYTSTAWRTAVRLQSTQYLSHMADVLLLAVAEDEEIVEVHHDIHTNDVAVDAVDERLEVGGGVRQTERHDEVLVQPSWVPNAVFHSSPSAMRTKLYAALRSSLLKIFALLSRNSCSSMRGSGARFLTVTSLRPL